MINLRFESRALPADTFQVLQFDGEEEISKLYHFELLLVSRDPDIDFEAVLESSAQLAITAQGNTRYLNGMISRFDQGGQWQNGLYEYRAVLVPRLWIMAQSTQNQIFRELTVLDIVESELSSISKKGSHPLVRDGLSVDDYEIYTIRDYDEREYVVQYKETDHNFISRLMEHEGIYYYFEQDDIHEKLVVTDAMATEEITGDSYAVFQSEASATHYDSNVVYKLTRSQQQIPDSVLVKDFNYRSPSMPMQSDSQVDENGIGFVTEFGAHFKEPEQGQVLATLRAEEFRCRQNVYTGESNIAAMTCAGLYSLGQHFRREYNQTYMITRVKHSGSQEIESWGNVGSTRYNNEFDCIPSGIPYRPERLTPKPKLYGIMNGTIDSELDTGRADIDELGRYKVMMPFDISGVGPGMGSRRIRMAQPYGGGGSGMSFPLIKGTEVIWTCIDGDIDRPIITGAVPNPLNPSVTTVENNTSNVIRTTSGITMGFHDGTGSGSANTTGGGAGGGLAAQHQFQSNDSSFHASQNNQVQLKPSKSIFSPISQNGTLNDQLIESQQQLQSALSLSDTWQAGQDIEETDTNFQIKVPYPTGSASYLRMGKKANSEAITGVDIKESTGWVDYTDGDRLSVTQGDKIEHIGGSYSLNIADGALMESDASLMWHDSFSDVGGGVYRRTTVDWTASTHVTVGDTEEVFGGAKFDGFVGFATGVTVGGSLTASLAADIAVNAGYDFTLGSTVSNDSQDVRTEISTDSHQMTAGRSMKINVKAADAAAAGASNKFAIAGIGALSAATTAAILAVPALVTEKPYDAGSISNIAVGGGYGIAAALHAGLVAKSLAQVAASKIDGAEVVELDMKCIPPSIRLGMGAGPTMPAMPGIDISHNKITIGYGGSSQIAITPTGIELQVGLGNITVRSNHFGMSTNTAEMKSVISAAITGPKVDIGTPASAVKIQGANVTVT
jgi:type VI secretion system VgrG family protein